MKHASMAWNRLAVVLLLAGLIGAAFPSGIMAGIEPPAEPGTDIEDSSPDVDADGVPDASDNCVEVANAG